MPLRLDIGPETSLKARPLQHDERVARTASDGQHRGRVLPVLDEISDELRSRASQHMDDVVQPLPAFTEADGQWSMDGEVKDGHIYELAFDGSDAHAEIIERTTGLSFLGDATDPYDVEKPCHMTGEMTTRRVLLAKSY